MAETMHGHFADQRQRHEAVGFGLLIFLASESLLFIVPLALYAGAYAAHGSSFTAGATYNIGWFGLAGTVCLLCASAVVAAAVTAVAGGRVRLGRGLLLCAAALGGAFLAGKGYEYADHIAHGILPGGRGSFYEEHPQVGLVPFFNLYWVTTALHALHVVVGVGLLLFGRWLAPRNEGAFRVELVAWYWHFVDLVWLFLWPAFYTVGGA